MNTPIEDFKTRFNKVLSAKNIKPAELAEKTGLSKSTISHYMSGYTKPKSDKLFILCKSLNVNEQWLMGYDVPMEKEHQLDKEVVDFFNEIYAFETQLKALGWHYEPKGCHASKSIEFELKLDDDGNFIDTENNRPIGCDGKKCEDCVEKESYYLFSNGQISFKVTVDDYNSFINDSETFFKERLQLLLKKSMKQLFIENSSDKSHLEVNAARPRTDLESGEITSEMKKHDEDIMDDPNF